MSLGGAPENLSGRDAVGEPLRVSVFPVDGFHSQVWLVDPGHSQELSYSPELRAALLAWQREWDTRPGDWSSVERWISDGQRLVLRLQAELGPDFSVSLGVGPYQGCRADLLIRTVERREIDQALLDDLSLQAASRDYADRARVGVRLVADADVPALGDLLMRLLLDHDDTFVTQEISHALLARGDYVALRLYAKGFHLADDDQAQEFGNPVPLVQARHALWEDLANDPNQEVASGAQEILAWVDAQTGNRTVR